jgi:hypothetical protein
MGRIIPYIMENKKQFETTILLSFQTPPSMIFSPADPEFTSHTFSASPFDPKVTRDSLLG